MRWYFSDILFKKNYFWGCFGLPVASEARSDLAIWSDKKGKSISLSLHSLSLSATAKWLDLGRGFYRLWSCFIILDKLIGRGYEGGREWGEEGTVALIPMAPRCDWQPSLSRCHNVNSSSNRASSRWGCDGPGGRPTPWLVVQQGRLFCRTNGMMPLKAMPTPNVALKAKPTPYDLLPTLT